MVINHIKAEVICMHTGNYFVKLLMISTKDDDFLLLYGFCSATAQEPYEWCQDMVPKTNQSIWKAILTEEEYDDFLNKLTQSGIISLAKKSFTSPQLLKRPIVLSNDGLNKEKGPIEKYRQLTEFWNTNKTDLFNGVIQSIGAEGKELYRSAKKLFDWISEESGIELLKNGYRFGNFEDFHHMMHDEDFEIIVHKECGLLKTTVTKTREFSSNLIVNCISEHRGRTICNCTKIFLPDEQSLEFEAEEPMSKVVVQIWDVSTGELIFSYNDTLCMGISIGMNLESTPYQVKDPWSDMLFKSASNRSKIIKKHIETVSHTRKFDNITINSESSNAIDKAMEEGYGLFASYRHSKVKGAFIKNVQKDGEIQSFLKIREYIDAPSVKHVIIADPFFSIEAAAKILARISRGDIQIDVITSLCNTDPDTGEEISNINAGTKLQEFLIANEHILHPNLLVCNLKRGGAQVFHDRYLLRYFEDGRIDGFLLSNSLNSMGQFYPFVIAPMEYEVCLEVSSYLESMRDADVQSKVNKKERITCDILYNSTEKRQVHQQELSETLFSAEWLSRWYDSDNGLRIPEQDIDEAVAVVMSHWNDDNNLACRTLCSVSASVVSYSSQKVAESIRNMDGLKDMFIDTFIPLAKERETARNHMKTGIESEECKHWMLLNGNAQPSQGDFSKIIERAGHIWYDTAGWLNSGYRLLFDLFPERYVELLENTKSPLMFDVLIYKLTYYNWSNEVIRFVVEKGRLYMQLVCADCIFQKLKMDWLSIEEIKDILIQLPFEQRVILMVRLLSEITFDVRIRSKAMQEHEQKQWNLLSNWLLDSIAADIGSCTPETQNNVIYWLYDCEAVSKCNLHFNMADKISDCSIKNRLLDEAISTVQKEILDCSYERDMEDIISMYLKCIDVRFGQDSEREMHKQVIDWKVFETASEPELKNYAYTRWRKAIIRAKRQMQLLYAYLEKHPDSAKTKKCVDMWEKRIEWS